MGISWGHILIILLIVLLLFGANRIPELARSFGKGVREFKKGLEGLDEVEEEPVKKKAAARKSTAVKKSTSGKAAAVKNNPYKASKRTK
jgi:sec-independent protein translocase protein TatA